MRDGKRKTFHTVAGEVPISVPRDRAGLSRPAVAPEHIRRPAGLDDVALSIQAPVLTHLTWSTLMFVFSPRCLTTRRPSGTCAHARKCDPVVTWQVRHRLGILRRWLSHPRPPMERCYGRASPLSTPRWAGTSSAGVIAFGVEVGAVIPSSMAGNLRIAAYRRRARMWWMVSELSRPGWRSSDSPQRPVLFVNPRSGGGKAARAEVAERARERGLRPSSLRRARAWKRWSGKPWPMVRTRWGLPVATGRRRS